MGVVARSRVDDLEGRVRRGGDDDRGGPGQRADYAHRRFYIIQL